MITGLQQRPIIDRSVPSLIGVWNSGLVACRAVLMYGIESAMGPDEFLAAAGSQERLLDLVKTELVAFKKFGWSAIPGAPADQVSQIDGARLSSFGHNSVSPELYFPAHITLAKLNRNYLETWHRESQHIYRRRPPLDPMIRGVCHAFLPFASMMRVELSPDTASTRIFRDSYYDSARIAFSNLIHNAIKFNRPAGSVVIKNDGLRLLFKDDGIGMEPDFVARLLDEEEPVREEDRIGDVPGTGHGWVAIKRIAKDLGWSIILDSIKNEGTTVEIFLNGPNFYRPGKTITSTFAIVDASGLAGAADIVEAAKVYTGMEPFEGYRVTRAGSLDISKSAIYRATQHAQSLVDSLYAAREKPSDNLLDEAQRDGACSDGL